MHKRISALEKLNNQFSALATDQELNIDVLGEGPVNAEVVVVGEGPGETEVRTGRPWTGGAGNMLFNSLRPYGLHRANIYITNVVKRQISLSRGTEARHQVYRDELNKWIGLLKWELEQLPNARIVLILGNYALEALSGPESTGTSTLSGITQWRGSVLEAQLPNGRKGKLILTFNPAFVMRDLRMEPMFKQDIEKLDRVVRNVFKPYDIEHLINPTFKEVTDYIRKLKSDRRPVAWDIEQINGYPACHGLSNDPHQAMCINLRDDVANRFSLKEEVDLHYALQDLFTFLERERIDLIAQNGQFDAYFTWLMTYLRAVPSVDILLAHHTLYPQLPHSLAFQVAQYTNHPYYKDEGKTWKEGGDINVYWRYNCKDAALTLACWLRERKELIDQQMMRFFRNHVMRLQPYAVESTVHGVATDLEAKAEAIESTGEKVQKHLAEFYRLVHEATGDQDYFPNPLSNQQMSELFFNRLKLKGRGKSTDEANRDRMIASPDTPPIAKEMLTAHTIYRKADKFLGTFAEVKLDTDNRFRCEWKQYGVTKAPGRLSSSKLLVSGVGQNMQNQPPAARRMYVADPGCELIYFDLSQAEARVVAYRADIHEWKEQFERARIDGSYDCHRALAASMFKKPYDEIPKKDTYIDEHNVEQYTLRYIAKRCRHGLNYRMQVHKLAEVTELPYHEARRAFSLYHRLTPELKRWWAQAVAEFRRTKVCFNALGRRLKIIQRINDDVLDSIVAFYPQSTIGDKVQQVWYQSIEDDQWPIQYVRIAINVHDSLTGIAVCIPEKHAKTALRIMKKYAEQPLFIQDAWNNKAEPLIIPAETKVSSLDIRDRTGKVVGKDRHHRWSNLVEVHV